jgi:hypothetical protein
LAGSLSAHGETTHRHDLGPARPGVKPDLTKLKIDTCPTRLGPQTTPRLRHPHHPRQRHPHHPRQHRRDHPRTDPQPKRALRSLPWRVVDARARGPALATPLVLAHAQVVARATRLWDRAKTARQHRADGAGDSTTYPMCRDLWSSSSGARERACRDWFGKPATLSQRLGVVGDRPLRARQPTSRSHRRDHPRTDPQPKRGLPSQRRPQANAQAPLRVRGVRYVLRHHSGRGDRI